VNDKLEIQLSRLRVSLERAFSTETSSVVDPICPSAGHCALVAIFVQQIYGGELLSVMVQGQSHWYNRVGQHEIDLTADQFGRACAIVHSIDDPIWPNSRVRSIVEVKVETFVRLHRFLQKLFEHGVLKISK
jgi:hypothetical protein